MIIEGGILENSQASLPKWLPPIGHPVANESARSALRPRDSTERPVSAIQASRKEDSPCEFRPYRVCRARGQFGGEWCVSTTSDGVEDLPLQIVKARAGKSSDREVWEVLDRVTEEILLLWADRDRDPVFGRVKTFH